MKKMSEATGNVGEVYSSETSSNFAELKEYAIGWKQITPTTRVKVIGYRISHSVITWKEID